jgi:hypothetical protein
VATRPDDEPKPQRQKEKEKETGRGGGIAHVRRGRLKTAWQGSGARLAQRQKGRIVIGLAKAAARLVDGFARAMKEALLSPQQLALEREQQHREAADRQVKAELDERLQAIKDLFEEQRRRLLEQQQEAENRRACPTAFAEAKAAAVSDSHDYFWQHHWQNEIEMDTGSAEIPETEPTRDFSADFDGAARPSLDLG